MLMGGGAGHFAVEVTGIWCLRQNISSRRLNVDLRIDAFYEVVDKTENWE